MGNGERRRRGGHDEPVIDADDIDDRGPEPIYIVGCSEGGFAYGPTVAALRRATERDALGAGWARAKRVLRELVELEVGAVRDIGWVKKLGDGLSREIFGAQVELADGRSDPYVVALPRGDSDVELDERTSRELRLIAALRRRTFPFRLPQMVGAFPDGERLALVRRFVLGIELDLRAGRQPAVKPWEIIGEIAASIHGVTAAEVAGLAPGVDTRRAHAEAAIADLADLAPIEMQRAHAWALAHLPPADLSSLLHGDLLGSNILLSLDGPHHVIDWEYARRGDPAYDLAIVTRGAKRPFQIDGGLERLLDAYRAHGGRDVTVEQVRVHELALIAGWYRDALAGRGAHAPSHELDRMRSLLRRLS